MAATRLMAMHVNKGKTIAQCLTDRTGYSKNPNKTNAGEYISAYECDPAVVDAQFLLAKRQYKTTTGRDQKNDVIAYQIRQSFKPGEIMPEKANRIGYELAMLWTKGRHAFIVSTHVDRAHIHNHIIYNSTTLDCSRKFRDFLGSGLAVQRISDRLCIENGLSIIANPERGSSSYGKWLGDKQRLSNKSKLKIAIDAALAGKPVDYADFIQRMTVAGYEYKPGKQPSFRAASEGRFTRLRSLKDGYSEAEIRAVIAGERKHTPTKKQDFRPAQAQMNLLIDIQEKLQAGKGIGYERWARVFNLKQMAQTINYLSDNGLLEYSALVEKADSTTARFNELSNQIKTAEKRLVEIAVLKTHIINYVKTRETYAAYRRAGYSKAFLADHESDILLHKAAKKAFDDLGVKKLPTVKALQTEYAALLKEKKATYAEYTKARSNMREVQTAKANVDRLLGKEKEKCTKTQEQERK